MFLLLSLRLFSISPHIQRHPLASPFMISQIVVENFKSYEGRQLIGPFRKFTCVIGPNGAGKSNLMDAISFVLGVQARVLRSEKLRDLIYRREGEDPKKNQRTASVDLAYVDDAAGGEGETLVFSRAITKSGEARFFVCGQAVTQAEYLKRLEGINILSKVRNFLVFQGDVDATAQRQGKDLTAFFEQISGSEQLRPEYERLAAAKTKIEDNARFLFTKKRNAINEKKRVQQQKDEADEYRRLEGERCGLQREFYLFRLHGISQHLEEVVRNRAGARADLDAHRAAAEAERAGLEAADAERARAHLATAQAEKAESGARARLDKAKPEQVAVASRLEFVRQRIEGPRLRGAPSSAEAGPLIPVVRALLDKAGWHLELPHGPFGATTWRLEALEAVLARGADSRKELNASAAEFIPSAGFWEPCVLGVVPRCPPGRWEVSGAAGRRCICGTVVFVEQGWAPSSVMEPQAAAESRAANQLEDKQVAAMTVGVSCAAGPEGPIADANAEPDYNQLMKKYWNDPKVTEACEKDCGARTPQR
ncbi:unnamed protein product [Prorocentrum cordatum]|uniref:RecF/RecN/SMC N-terminal domain-containing protein n=1 Tax=Prorocentrum cordatum TaxID=2364126 RepID=A0ABN9UCT1_9DINO|nr:unnamed protein product [Polarella glacialis]